MQASQIPSKFQIPWASSAGSSYIRTIPQASQISIQNGAASLTDGFPPNTFIPPAAGGVGPFGQDMNGILKQITQWNQWQQAGGSISYDATFQSSIGGYPKNSIILSATTNNLYWLSTVDNNITNPDTGGAGWTKFGIALQPTRTVLTVAGTGTYTTKANCTRLSIRMVAGGGGGGGANGGSGGTNGGNTVFNLITANGGVGGNTGSTGVALVTGGAGGSGGAGSASFRTPGGSGNEGAGVAAGSAAPGSAGGCSAFGGPGAAGSGGGGGNVGSGGGVTPGSGGGAGEYVELLINTPSATYSYTVGAGGAAGAVAIAGTAGAIIIDEYYN